MNLHDGFFFFSQFSCHIKDYGIMDVSRWPSNNEILNSLTCTRRNVMQNQTKPFSLILPNSNWSSKKQIEMDNSLESSSIQKQIEMDNSLESSSLQVLRSGMVLLKNYVTLSEQVEIVNKCEELGVGPGGFYQPSYGDGAKLHLQMMCLGRNWDPQTRYEKRYRSDGSEAPPIPDELTAIVKNALEVSQSLTSPKYEFPLMSPDVCIVNFYTTSGRMGLHEDRDESSNTLRSGSPVVSVSIGDSAVFLYGVTRDKKSVANILLESGDVLIFGGKSRRILHGVKTIIPESAPEPLLQKTLLRPGRLNLTFRQF